MKVRFARGGTDSIVIPVRDWMDHTYQDRPAVPYSAAAQLDGIRGDEIVIDVDSTPASYARYLVVADHGGRLTLLPAPPRHTWWVGASVGTGGNTYDCGDGHLTAIDATPISKSRPKYRIVSTSYRWANGGWQRLHRTVRVGSGLTGRWVCNSLADWLT